VLCSQWVNEMWSSECLAFYSESCRIKKGRRGLLMMASLRRLRFFLPSIAPHYRLTCSFNLCLLLLYGLSSSPLVPVDGTSAATTQKMVCQNTCLEYSSSEYSLVNNTDYCPGPDMTNGNRNTNLVKDFTDCTNWTSLATKDLTSCVSGMSNEGRCGFGTATTELCTFCSGSSPDPCCYQCEFCFFPLHIGVPMLTGVADSGASVCGYVLPAQTTGSGTSTATSSSPSPSSSGSLQHDDSSSSSHLKGGKLAGTIVGAVIGGVLVSFAFLSLPGRIKANGISAARTSRPPPIPLHAPPSQAATPPRFCFLLRSGRRRCRRHRGRARRFLRVQPRLSRQEHFGERLFARLPLCGSCFVPDNGRRHVLLRIGR